MDKTVSLLKDGLKKYWNYNDFRYPQQEIMEAILAGKDCLVVLPTGGGKSLCFQLPALLQTGLTIVISPLVALMENQVQQLRQKNLPATLLHGEVSRSDRQIRLRQLQQPNQPYRLLYLSPETLLSPVLWSLLNQPQLKINGFILDEAHCLTQWGDSFRPAYDRLGILRSSLSKQGKLIPFACFTATANSKSQNTIVTALRLRSPQKFLISPFRDNLAIDIKQVWTPKGKQKQLLKFIAKRKNTSGLIYVRTRKDSIFIAQLLTAQGYSTHSYHGGLSPVKRREVEADWLSEKVKFVVCTSAFGMGIDKSNLRWIFHYQTPLLLSEYIQEIGRGGRDGKLTEAIALVSETTGLFNPQDKQRRKYFQEQQLQLYRSALRFLKTIPTQGNINELFSNLNDDRNAHLYLAILHRSQQLRWLDTYTYQLTLNSPQQAIDNLTQQYQKQIKQTEQYFKTKRCRWAFLLSAFNFPQSNNFACGKCDNCQ